MKIKSKYFIFGHWLNSLTYRGLQAQDVIPESTRLRTALHDKSKVTKGEKTMEWYIAIAYFMAGVFLANGVPHFVQGTCGSTFQSPFASPPGVGESSAVVNVIWGLANFLFAYLIFSMVGDFRPGVTFDALLVGLGMLSAGMFCAIHFGKVRKSGG